MEKAACKAFSLVEMSIVLVIIGLLTGGVLMGKNLMRNADLKSIPAEYSVYKQATIMFKDKYYAVPGDIPNATDFWGTSTLCGGSDAEGVCNGDGDGYIEQAPSTNVSGERFQFWRHLVAAGLIEGDYTGSSTSMNNHHHIIGENCPKGKIRNSGWTAYSMVPQSGNGQFFDGIYQDVLWVGTATTNTSPNGDLLTPAEMKAMDEKIDDGKPAKGWVVTRERVTCTNAANAAADSDKFDATYSISDKAIRCTPLFRQITREDLIQ